MAKIIIKLTKVELNYLLDLVDGNIRGGTYWGMEKYFRKRQKCVLQKLKEGLGE